MKYQKNAEGKFIKIDEAKQDVEVKYTTTGTNSGQKKTKIIQISKKLYNDAISANHSKRLSARGIINSDFLDADPKNYIVSLELK